MKKSCALDSYDFAIVKLKESSIKQKKTMNSCFLRMHFSILRNRQLDFISFINEINPSLGEDFMLIKNSKNITYFNLAIIKIAEHFDCDELYFLNVNKANAIFFKGGRELEVELKLRDKMNMNLIKKHWIDMNLDEVKFAWDDFASYQINSKMIIHKLSDPILELLDLKK